MFSIKNIFTENNIQYQNFKGKCLRNIITVPLLIHEYFYNKHTMYTYDTNLESVKITELVYTNTSIICFFLYKIFLLNLLLKKYILRGILMEKGMPDTIYVTAFNKIHVITPCCR